MRLLPLILFVLLMSCSSNNKQVPDSAANDVALIEREIADFHQMLARAYSGEGIKTDSLIDSFFDKDVYYVTYWGLTEPIDSTKMRVRKALLGIKNYENRIEIVQVKTYGQGAYAFFILRQTYTLNGIFMDEYLPTTFVLERRNAKWVVVHSQRSADFQTIQHLMKIAAQ
jgi:hypothetical protein